ncbi:F-box protein At2g26850-like isoform X1 [Vicia villosa]|uniref:F-box protein At2g26850-like isoform X1 n=1 Tax=Vicia villosa TaxID=3911 RepID=UPI00273C6DAD|nr:F-box protein At2g26850-like isoform X1 [Vicia villosa]
MLYFLISFLSFLMILSKSFTNKSNGTKHVFYVFCGKLFSFLASRIKTRTSFFQLSLFIQSPNKSLVLSKLEEDQSKVSLLDLHDLPLDCILEKLSPSELCNVGKVCKSLRKSCRSDYLWEKHMKMKWGKVFGDAAYREWKCYVASRNIEKSSKNHHKNQKNILHDFLHLFWIKSKAEKYVKLKLDDSIASLYLSLESGSFWFPAQVYNRENGHAGFMLSCYDAQLCYDSRSDTFQARYSPHGRWTTEENIKWERLRVPPIDSCSYVLHVSDCLDDLRPGDHVEIQWRKNKEFPYGWWYSVIGHLETCQIQGNHCQCHNKDIVILEFRQYKVGSRWRQTMINRKNHREEGNGIEGFYGGIRKLHSKEEITKWKNLRPIKIVE